MVAESVEVRALFAPAIARSQSGSVDGRASFVGSLFARHRRALLWYLTKLTSSQHDAEEVAQEAVLRLLRVENLECDPRRARHYLFRTATNIVRDNHRRSTARCAHLCSALDDLQLEADTAPVDRLIDAEREVAVVAAALRDLSTRARAAFLMHVLEDLTYERIAAELGVSKKTIERDIALALALCRVRLARWRDG
jgi:RNA polymerase sigma factor (sigma-70 family)